MFVRSTGFSSAAPLRRLQTVVAACAVACALAAPDAYAQGRRPAKSVDILPITITSVVYSGGTTDTANFVVSGLAGAEAFTTSLVMTAQPNEGGSCPILNLALGPIELSVLGLNVETSPICLDVTAEPGPGNLLGNLLCAVANLLNGGLATQGLLNLQQGITAAEMTTLQNALTSLLDQALDTITSSQNFEIVQATCEILFLQVGPLDLNLLGLRVQLDDCGGGPVTIEITATQGGGLLGDLLCGLANLLNTPNPNQNAILGILSDIAAAIAGLLG